MPTKPPTIAGGNAALEAHPIAQGGMRGARHGGEWLERHQRFVAHGTAPVRQCQRFAQRARSIGNPFLLGMAPSAGTHGPLSELAAALRGAPSKGPLQRGCADGAMPLTWQATPDQSPRSGRTTAPRSEPAFPAGLAAPAGPPSAVVVDRIQQAVTRPVLENHSAAPESFAAEAAGPRRKFLDPRQVAARCHTVDVGNAAIPQVALHTMAGIAVLALPVSAKTAKPIPFRVVNIPVAI